QLLIGLRKKKTGEIKKRLPPNLTKNQKSFAGSGKTRRQRGDAYRYNVKEVKSDLSHLLRFQSP
ncbi:hypothetical protein, partial [Bacteroides ovatus]|uniref:hypothetical protein n=1 Tax=Bacteroides kribbi TaxID=1912894 RepID=UPI00356793CA